MYGKKIRIVFIEVFLLCLVLTPLHTENIKYVTAKPKDGDGLYSILKRHMLPSDGDNIDKFKELNKGSFDSNGGLKMSAEYKLPIVIYKYNGSSIRSTIGDNNLEKAKKIQDYNIALHNAGVKGSDYRVSRELWVPMYGMDVQEKSKSNPKENSKTVYEIFGAKYSKVKVIDAKLKGRIFYLISGHGGPDPGALGYSGTNELCEDEYAYEVVLRLGRNLIQHGATVYFIVRDTSDGIRDEKFLKCDNDEINYDGTPIPLEQIDRLNKRTDIVNALYNKNKSKAKSQRLIEVHVDSRETREPIDIFFYYAPGDEKGKKFTESLYETIKKKYGTHRPGRVYKGFTEERNLHTLRKALPTSTYIELGNIQNEENQTRLLESSNRQSIADWLCEGILKHK